MFSATTNEQLGNKIIHEEVKFEQDVWKDSISESLQNLVKGLLNKNPNKRKTAESLITLNRSNACGLPSH